MLFPSTQVLLEDVIPTYYDDKKRWQEMMQASICHGYASLFS